MRDAYEQANGTTGAKSTGTEAAAIAALIEQLRDARIDLISGMDDHDRWRGMVDDLAERRDDASRSGADFSLAAMLKAVGFSHLEAAQILCAFQHGKVASGELDLETGLRYVAHCVLRSREPRRPFGTGGPNPSSTRGEEAQTNEQNNAAADPAEVIIDAAVAEINAEFMVVTEGGHVVIFKPEYDPMLNRRHFVRFEFADFKRWFMNRHVPVGMDEKST